MSSVTGCKIYWKATPEDIKKRTDTLSKAAIKIYDEIGSLQENEVTFSSVAQKLSLYESEYSIEGNMLEFFQHVSADKELREASSEADKQLAKLSVELSMRKDVFDKFVALSEMPQDAISDETKRFIERKVKLGKRNGLHLAKEVRDKIQANMTRQSEICIDFERNLGEDTTTLEFTREELTGCPEDFVDSLEKTLEGKVKMTLKYPHYFPCMKKARNPDARMKLEKAFNSRSMKENSIILDELVELRSQRAALLGYSTHADYVLEMRMAKTASKVTHFLEDLAKKLRPLKDKEIQVFLKYKKEECEAIGVPFNGQVDMWDLRFLMNLCEERDYAVDHELLKPYFPLAKVTSGLLHIYQTLLGLRFDKVDVTDLWHEEVSMYVVHDAASDALIGYFYLDLHPREGKYGHAAVFGLQPGCMARTPGDGDSVTRQPAVAALVCNFTRPTSDRPALLLHDEVETFFHEFGHVMHQLCAQAEHSLFAGTKVERDFVECPSQMLENWCWEEASLRLMSGHYLTGAPIPDELLQPLLKSRLANAGVFNMRQILLATFDQTIHTQAKADCAAVYADVADRYLGVSATPGTNMPATFGHMAGGYDAQYYGYMWSEVFSADLFFSRFKTEGVMNSKTGADYRRYILQPGGSIDAEQMLRNFLGREPMQEAFLKMKGL